MIGDSSIEITVSRFKAKALREELNTWYRWVSLSYKETKGWLSSHFVISGPPKDIEWFMGYLEGGQVIRRYMEIDKVSNGWMVVVHTDFRDKEVSPETATARAQAKLETARKTKEATVKSLKLQLEAAKLLKDEMVNEGEDWKGDESESFDDKLKGLVDEMYSQYQGTEQQPMVLTSLGSAFGLNPQTETRVFTNRQDMIQFVTEMLQPIIE